MVSWSWTQEISIQYSASRALYVLKLFALTRVFQIAVKAGGIPPVRESEILLGGGIFLPGKGNLRRSDFDYSSLF